MLEDVRKGARVKPVIRWVSVILLLAFILPASSALAATPDLIIESITWSPENPSRGDTVTISVSIQNQGTSQALPPRVPAQIDRCFNN